MVGLLNPRLFNPLHWHLMPLLRDPKIRYIYLEGGSSASKTAEICNALLIDGLQHDYSAMVFRRFHVHIRDSVYNSFKESASRLDFNEMKFFTYQQDLIKSNLNSAQVRFKGLDDEENIKGIESFDVIYNNEWSQIDEEQWSQQRKRLRGRPNQKFICDWNPISAQMWQYTNWLDLDEWRDLPLSVPGVKYSQLDKEHAFKRINKRGNAVWIKVTYRDNYWVVGHPSGKGGFKDVETLADFEWDRIHKPNFYRIYANGERGIIRTGGEFWNQFNESTHVMPLKVVPGPIHVSLDMNVHPYVTVSLWQLVGDEIRQVHEIAAKAPNNNAPKAANLLLKWLDSIGFEDVLFMYGDPSAGARSAVDPNNSSFFDKFSEVMVAANIKLVNRVARAHPEVALSAAFINDIYENELFGHKIIIGDSCKVSIDDYATVKADANGRMLKPKVKDKQTGVTYEPNGHFSDAKRYFIIKVLESEFKQYKSRSNRVRIYSA